jgi:Tol biopolymer transport system component
LLFTNPRNLVPGTWTPDGRRLFYYEIPSDAAVAAQGGSTLWVQARDEKNATPAVSESVTRAGGVDVSPDGRWMAYQSPASGEFQVYVDAFPGPGPRFQISTRGGGSPVWRADGGELYYTEPMGKAIPGQLQPGSAEIRMMAVTVTTRPTLSFGQPRPLFTGRYSMNAPARGYDVAADGQRFLLLQERERTPDVVTGMTVVQNWIEELR